MEHDYRITILGVDHTFAQRVEGIIATTEDHCQHVAGCLIVLTNHPAAFVEAYFAEDFDTTFNMGVNDV